MHKSTFSRDCL